MEGIIRKALSGFYYVDDGTSLTACRGRGKLRHAKVTPLVGDRVEFTPLDNGQGAIDAILPRKNQFQRPAVANIDQLVIVASQAIPVTDPFLIDRVIAIAEGNHCESIVCINKCDLASGGELARLRFAELALERPNLMFLDEPTNHLDIYMRESLTQALAAYTGTLLLVTHDRYLMQTLGCPIMYLEDGKATFYPNFAALQNRDAGKTQEQQKTEDTAKKQAYGKEQRKRRAEVRARLKKVESEIEELGAHIVELENEINDPEVLRDHLLLRDKCDELDDTRFHQQELYDEWEKLAEEQETFENEGE